MEKISDNEGEAPFGSSQWLKDFLLAQGEAAYKTQLASEHIDGKHQEKLNSKCPLCWPTKEAQEAYWLKKQNEYENTNDCGD